jgi:hypothetical protein
MQWLQEKHCNLSLVNHNGHGVLHKAAQRGQQDVCRWFFKNFVTSSSAKTALKLVGPDPEDYCPSDLAGMEGYEDLARFLALSEMDLIRSLKLNPSLDYSDSLMTSPGWLHDSRSGISMRICEKDQYTWERHGGIRRMRSKLSHTANET